MKAYQSRMYQSNMTSVFIKERDNFGHAPRNARLDTQESAIWNEGRDQGDEFTSQDMIKIVAKNHKAGTSLVAQ